MASLTLNIQGGTAPYIISVKKVGDDTERFISYFGNSLTFSGDASNQNITYNVKITDSSPTPCVEVRAFSLNCFIPNPDPKFNVTYTQPLCGPNGYTGASITVTNIEYGARYILCLSPNADCKNCLDSNDNITNNQSFTINVGLVGVGTIPFTLRVFGDQTCDYYKDFHGNFILPNCTPEQECDIDAILGTPTCGTVPLTILNGQAPYIISVKKQNEGYPRFISYNNNTLNFEVATDGVNAQYNVIINDANGCSVEKSFQVTCGSQGCNINATIGTPKCDENTNPCNNNVVLGTPTCNNNIGSISYAVTGMTTPLTISVKKTGISDTTERFLSYNNNIINFTSDSGTNFYTIKVTDANGCVRNNDIGLECSVPEGDNTLSENDVLLVSIKTGSSNNQANIYKYQPDSNNINLLFSTDILLVTDIAHTSNKIFLSKAQSSPNFTQTIDTYDITTNPFTYSNKKQYTISNSEAGNAGVFAPRALHAINNNTLLAIGPNAYLITLNDDLTHTKTKLFSTTNGAFDTIYDATSQIMISIEGDRGTTSFPDKLIKRKLDGTILKQVDLPTKSFEIIYQYLGKTYVGRGAEIFEVNMNTFGVTLVKTLNSVNEYFIGGSQLASKISIPN